MLTSNPIVRAAPSLALVALLAVTGCDKEEASESESAQGAAAAEPAATSPEPSEAAESCELSVAEVMIESVELRNSEGTCRVLIPSGASPGTLEVQISAAGDASAAAVEWKNDEGTSYATDGTVTLTEAGGGRFVGSVDARDDTPPHTGSFAASFDLSTTP